MLHKVNTLKGYTLMSQDGEIGKTREFYFDDHHWAIRYVVADTGNWLTGRKVLLSPRALSGVNSEEKHITVNLTKSQIENSPPLSSDKPVSRQYETDYHSYYAWPFYWTGPSMWGMYPVPNVATPFTAREPTALEASEVNTADENQWDLHLRSTHDVTGHHIEASDGEIGHVEDFIIDDGDWAIRYLVVATHNWLPGKKVLIAPTWIERVSWEVSKIFVHLTREAIEKAPEYTNATLITRAYESALHEHYQRAPYWSESRPEIPL